MGGGRFWGGRMLGMADEETEAPIRRDIASERETAYLLGTPAMRQRLEEALARDEGVSLEEALARLGLS